MTGLIEARLADLGLELPPAQLARFVEFDRSDHITRQHVVRDGGLHEQAVDIHMIMDLHSSRGATRQ